jgi:hypothetical protein
MSETSVEIKAKAAMAITRPDGVAILKALALEIEEWFELSIGKPSPQVDQLHGAIIHVRAWLDELDNFAHRNKERPVRSGGYSG